MAEIDRTLHDFVAFLFKKVYYPSGVFCPSELIHEAYEVTVKDVQYHEPHADCDDIWLNITLARNELPVFLYRLGSIAYQKDPVKHNDLLNVIHWIMQEVCACQIYYSNRIGEGFRVVHGVGTVIGSRNTIGKGFKVYQGVTIGHRKDKESGCVIGDDVTVYANASILGAVNVPDKTVVKCGEIVK